MNTHLVALVALRSAVFVLAADSAAAARSSAIRSFSSNMRLQWQRLLLSQRHCQDNSTECTTSAL
jgi:hypothetical protein